MNINQQYRIKLFNGISNEWANTGEFDTRQMIEINKFTVLNKPLTSDKIKTLENLLNELKKSDDFKFVLDEVKSAGRDQELLLSKEQNNELNLDQNDGDSFVEKRVLQRLKYQGLEVEFESELFEVLEKNVDRIQFVKDAIYARDVLFVLGKRVDGYPENLYVSINTNANVNRSFEENAKISLESRITGELLVINELKKFFAETDRKMFVYVGFAESLRINADAIENAGDLSEKTNVEMMKFERKNKMFPDWYKDVAKFPEELNVTPKAVSDYVNLLKDPEKARLKVVLKKYGKEHLIDQLTEK